MKSKLISIVLLTFFFTTSSYALENLSKDFEYANKKWFHSDIIDNWFVGIQKSKGTYRINLSEKLKVDEGDEIPDYNNTFPTRYSAVDSTSFTIGKYLGALKSYVKLYDFENSSDLKLKRYEVIFDYYFNNIGYSYFFGLGVGRLTLDRNNLKSVDTRISVDSVSYKTYTLPLRVGALFKVKDRFNIELGVDYTLVNTNMQKFVYNVENNISSLSTTNIDEVFNFYIGFEVKF